MDAFNDDGLQHGQDQYAVMVPLVQQCRPLTEVRTAAVGVGEAEGVG